MLKGHTLFQFGEFALDPVAKVLFKNGEPVRMTRRTVETLLVLVENAGQVLTKEEIMRAVWTDRVVDEANLAQNIAVIRKTLAVAKGNPGWIETFPGRGYRIEGPVTTPNATPAAPSATAPVDADEDGAPSVEVGTSTGGKTAEASPGLAAHGRRLNRTWIVVSMIVLALTLSLVIIWWKPWAGMAPADTFQVNPATRLPGREFQPALSADGSALAFLWTDEKNSAPSVWVIKQGEATPKLISSAQAHHSSPTWSPDGSQLAYLRISKDKTDIVLHHRDEPGERVLASLSPPTYGFDYRMMDWSPDGKWLAVSHAEGAGRPPGIWLVPVSGGEKRMLTRPGSAASGDVDPQFSPDGKRVTFLRMLNRSRQEIFSVAIDGDSQTAQLTQSGRRISAYDWLSDGKTLLVALNQGGEYRLWKLPNEGRGGPTQTGIYSEFPIQFSVTRQATALVYATLDQDRNIWRLDVTNGGWLRVVATTAQDASPVYSPDGKRIAFRSDRSGDEQLWVSDADGSNPVQITHSPMKPSVGRWSPDGRSIVFNNPQTFEIMVASLAGERWSVTPLGARGVHPVYSTDGKWILAGGSRLVRIPAGGGNAEVIAETRAEALNASPDGRYVYFVREPNDSTLWRVPLSNPGVSEPQRVFDQLLPGCTSCWSLGRGGIYYLGAKPEALDRQAIFFHSLSPGGADRVIADYPEPLWPQGSGPFSLSPDEKYLMVVRVGPAIGDVMRVQPFR